VIKQKQNDQDKFPTFFPLLSYFSKEASPRKFLKAAEARLKMIKLSI